jgi:transaldolase
MPVETIDAFRDHGKPRESLTIGVEHAERMLAGLAEVGIDAAAVTRKLEDEGVQKFIAGHDALLATLDRKCTATRSSS